MTILEIEYIHGRNVIHKEKLERKTALNGPIFIPRKDDVVVFNKEIYPVIDVFYNIDTRTCTIRLRKI